MEGDVIEVDIADVAFGGKGVGRHEGKAVFVPFAIPGERVRVRITREKKRFAEAEPVEILQPAADRMSPVCPYFAQCGGCAYQHVSYERQLELKSAQVEQTLRRIGRLESLPMQPMIAAPSPYGYRNRIRVHAVGDVVGFYAWDRRAVIDVEVCPIASAEVNERLAQLRRRSLREGDYTVSEGKRGEFFEQTNPPVAALLLEHVGSLLSPGRRVLVDAYCGAGAFARHLAGRFERVTGIEEDAFAVAQARRMAGANEEYLEGAVEDLLAGVLRAEVPEETTLVLDPPSAGLTPKALDAVLVSPPADVIYVSCDPATLARDLARLVPVYELCSITPLDMFPQTAEIEVAVRLRRASLPA